jgi:hypothetical protein
MYKRLRIKYLLFLSDFNETRLFSTYFLEIFKYQILWKSVQWEHSYFMRADRQTNRHVEYINFYYRFFLFLRVSSTHRSHHQEVTFHRRARRTVCQWIVICLLIIYSSNWYIAPTNLYRLKCVYDIKHSMSIYKHKIQKSVSKYLPCK